MSKWPAVALAEFCQPADRYEVPLPGKAYRQVGVRLWGEGAYERDCIDGAETTYAKFNRIESDDLIVNKIWARNGSVAVATPELAGGYVSTEFPTFTLNRDRATPGWIRLITKSREFWNACDEKAQGTSGKNRIKPSQFLSIKVPLPSLIDQKAIVARLDTLADKTRQLTAHLDATEADADRLLAQQFRAAIANAPRRAMAEVAPMEKRQVVLGANTRYREIGARSFGKGLFFKPDFDAAEATWEKPVWIKSGDVVFSNIKAWEGAIALAGDEHDEAIASHRYITCVTNPEQLLSSFLLYYLLSPEGLEKIGEASAGTADRNRTLSLKKLAKIEVPVPSLSAQQAFVDLQAIVSAIKARHAAIREANAALLPATLERLFSAEDRSL